LEQEDKENNRDSEGKIDMIEFNKMLQVKFEVINEIRKLVFDHEMDDKFIYNKFTNKT